MATVGNISNINLPDGNKYDIRATAIPHGTVDSTSTATVFTATVPGITALTDGTVVLLQNSVITSASGFTININGLGAKPVYSNMATGNPVTPTAPTRDTTIFNINYTMLFVYSSTLVEGGAWICYRGYNSDNNTIGYQLRTNSAPLPTLTRTRYYRILFTAADNEHWVPANTGYDNSATSKKTVNQNKINPFGRIVYVSGTTNYPADTNVGASVTWDQYTLALGYSFNTTGAALTLTLYKPVYVKCAPQTDGSAIIDSTTPYVQTLPSTEDGKIYIFLGVAYSATNIELIPEHPVYYYKDGAIRLWTDQADSGSTVSVTQKTSSGTNIADITIDGTTTQLYSPDEVFLVNVTLTDAVSGTSDKTSEEIYNAAIAGLVPVVKANMGTTYMVASLSLVSPDMDFSNIYHAVFTYEDQSNVAYKYCTMTITGTTVTLVYKDGYVTSSEISNYIPVKDVTVDGNSIVDGNDDYAKLVTSTTNPYNALTNPLATMGDISSAGGGTVTSITAGSGLTAVGNGGEPLPYTNTIVESGTIKLASAYGDTVNPYGKKSATYVLAGPSSGASAVPSFRKLNTSELNNDAGFVTTDTDTTYSISGSVSSHAAGTAFGFATILTAGGSGSGSTSAEVTFAPGSNITITNPSSNTIMISATGGASPNDGKLKLQKDSGTASDVFSANQSGDTTIKFTTAAIYHASTSTAFNQGTLPTISTTKITADDITSWTTNTPTAIDTTKFSGGSFTRGTFTGGSFTQGTDSFTAATHGNDSFTANAPTSITFSNSGGTSLSSVGMLIVSVTAGTSATFTQGTFSGGSFTQGNDSFTAATHAADSFTAASLQTGFYTAGSAASLSYTAREIPNVTSAGTLPTLSLTSTTVVTNISKV